jgi:hypothetical protein
MHDEHVLKCRVFFEQVTFANLIKTYPDQKIKERRKSCDPWVRLTDGILTKRTP